MNPFDIAVAVVIGFCLIRGFFRGFVKELASIVGVLAGFFAANMYYQVLADLLTRWVSRSDYLYILSFMIIFCGVLIIVSILGVVIRYLMNVAYMGWFDRIVGLMLGTVKGILISTVVLVTLTTFLPKKSAVVQDSSLAPHLMIVADKLGKVVSKEMKDNFIEKVEALKNSWQKDRGEE